jgi:hypothetical protein
VEATNGEDYDERERQIALSSTSAAILHKHAVEFVTVSDVGIS